jgi:hypothetical protein
MKHLQVAQLVEKIYLNSDREMAHWMWQNHLQLVSHQAEDLSHQFGANADLAVAGAWLHDLGDAFVDRHAAQHEEVSRTAAIKVLTAAGYSAAEIQEILEKIIEPHSCMDGNLPETLEGKVLATADALAHLTTDFYVQFAWKHVPEGKTYPEFISWAAEKLDRDFHQKIFFPEIAEQVKNKYLALRTVFTQSQSAEE